MTKRIDRGYVTLQREDLAAYCRAHELFGDDRGRFLQLLVEADHLTGAIEGDLGAIATEVLDVSRFTLTRWLARLEAAGVVTVNRSNAPSKGAIVITDYAALNPLASGSRRPRVERELSGSRAGVERESSESATTHQGKRTAYRSTEVQEDRSPPPASAVAPVVRARRRRTSSKSNSDGDEPTALSESVAALMADMRRSSEP